MSYFALVTFDIKNGDAQDYEMIYAGLSKLGFYTHITGDKGTIIQLPTTTCAGVFTASSAAAARDDLTERVEQLFLKHNLTGEVFVSVGGDWAWGYRKPQATRVASLERILAALNH